jgi:ribosome biogenesis protein NSA1
MHKFDPLVVSFSSEMCMNYGILFSGISISIEDKETKSIAKNIQNIKVLTKEHEITALAWGDPDEVDVLIGMSSQRVKIYDTDFKAFTSSVDASCGHGSIRGISRYKE